MSRPLLKWAGAAALVALVALLLAAPDRRTTVAPCSHPDCRSVSPPEHDGTGDPADAEHPPRAAALDDGVPATPDPLPSGNEQQRAERDRMVEEQILARDGVTSPSVIEAMRRVPRHLFVPHEQRRHAYSDRPLPIGYGQTISQPYIVAYMTQQLAVEADDTVLEIGTGSGYQAAVLAELTPHVDSIEIIAELARQGADNLKQAGYDTVNVRSGDGYFGWEEHAPFDKIIVTAAAGHVPPPLVQQLAPGGRMIIPVGSPYETQYLILLEKDQDGEVSSRHLLPVVFVPLTGYVQQAQ